MPVAYAVTYMFGTMGSAIVIAVLGPTLLRIDLVAACKDYEEKQGGGKKEIGGPGTAWHRWAVRAYRSTAGRARPSACAPSRPRRWCPMRASSSCAFAATARSRMRPRTPSCSEGDVVAIAGLREVLVKVLGANAEEVEDRELLAVPVEGVDVLVTNKEVDGKTLAELAQRARRRAAFSCARSRAARPPPIFPSCRTPRSIAATCSPSSAARRTSPPPPRCSASPIVRPTSPTWRSSAPSIVIGALIGALVFKVAGVPLTLSTAGGALIAGIVGGWLRSVRPTFGRIPTPTVWFMNSVGLNIFIAIVGISAGPGFVNGLKTQGIGLFLWGVVATTVPLVLGMFIAKYLFRFHDALILGIVSGARTTTASLGLVCDQAKSQVPGARLHRHLRRRQHAAHDLGHDHHHAAVVTRHISLT